MSVPQTQQHSATQQEEEEEEEAFTFCSFLKEDAFMFSDSLTEKYCRTHKEHALMPVFQTRSAHAPKGYEVPQLPEDLIHFPDLLLVFQVDRSVEVGDFVLLGGTLADDVIFTGMDELAQSCRDRIEAGGHLVSDPLRCESVCVPVCSCVPVYTRVTPLCQPGTTLRT